MIQIKVGRGGRREILRDDYTGDEAMLDMAHQSRAPALEAAFTRQLGLCDLLEAIADSLPDRVDRQECLSVARMIGPLMAQAHAAEERFLFPALAGRHIDGESVVEQLRLEHIEDECFAEEVQHELMQLGRGQPLLQPEATGYMLRGFFEGVRRHIRHEQELLTLVAPPQLN